jgi:hypothetical protein
MAVDLAGDMGVMIEIKKGDKEEKKNSKIVLASAGGVAAASNGPFLVSGSTCCVSTTSAARQEANFRLLDLTRLNELCLRSSFNKLRWSSPTLLSMIIYSFNLL